MLATSWTLWRSSVPGTCRCSGSVVWSTAWPRGPGTAEKPCWIGILRAIHWGFEIGIMGNMITYDNHNHNYGIIMGYHNYHNHNGEYHPNNMIIQVFFSQQYDLSGKYPKKLLQYRIREIMINQRMEWDRGALLSDKPKWIDSRFLGWPLLIHWNKTGVSDYMIFYVLLCIM